MKTNVVWAFCPNCWRWVEIPKETMNFYPTHCGGEFCFAFEAKCPRCGTIVSIDARNLNATDWKESRTIK